MKEILVTEPQLFSDFSCIGSTCKEHCCAHWKIVFDKKTVSRYLNSKDIEVRNIASHAIEVTKKNISHWGYVKLDEKTGACPFLNSSNLCTVHSNLGAKALSTTCSTYPRQTRYYQNERQHTLNLSCPQVSKLLITSPNAMSFKQQTLLQSKFYDAPIIDVSAKLVQLLCLNILNSSFGTVEEQLYAIVKLSMLVEKMDVIKDQDVHKLMGYYEQLLSDLNNGDMRVELYNLRVRNDIKANLISAVYGYFKASASVRGRKVLSHYLKGLSECCELENDSQIFPPEKILFVDLCWEKYCKPWFDDNDSVLRNIISYKFWQSAYPQKNGRSILSNLYLIVAEYYFMKVLFSIGAHQAEGLNDDLIVEVLYSFHSLSQHSPVASENFHRMISAINLNDNLSLIHLLK
ncbi:flagellin lysine-N-methylase [Siccibacter colletis]|uniref:flagellin lysine-N-methylase n=1 Tax=Siccibacter colletis TaxID=1505757 RepID=UPI0028BE07FC|nr:flagellin lysine-N-methylase [Siccibacter colletis]WNN47165.1 flagellin lysine-N-methylase [Siccibacter colletis]